MEEWLVEHADADPDLVHEFASWPGNDTSRNRVVRTYNTQPGVQLNDAGAAATAAAGARGAGAGVVSLLVCVCVWGANLS